MSSEYPKNSLNNPEEVHEMIGNLPDSWVRKANELLISSALLYERYSEIDHSDPREHLKPEAQVLEIILMLRGMAIECFLKAIWLDKGQNFIKDGRFRNIPNSGNHDLVAIANEVFTLMDMKISSEERRILERLTLSIERGRYPISKKPSPNRMAMRRKNENDLEVHFNLEWSLSKDESQFDSFISKLMNVLQE